MTRRGLDALLNAIRSGTQPWVEQAACRGTGPTLFFPEQGEATAPAKSVCGACPVAEQCAEYAIQGNEKFGLWGGLSERQRRRIRRDRGLYEQQNREAS